MKPRVMSLVIFTCVVGLLIAPIQVDFFTAMFSLIAVALGAGAAGTLNMWYESDIDALMQRTCLRPIPSGKISRDQALIFGVLTSFASVIMLYAFSNFFISPNAFYYNFVLRYNLYDMVETKNFSKYSYRRCSRSFSSYYRLDNCNK